MSFSLALAAAATPFADLASIDRQVAQFTGAAVGQPGGAQAPVDRRLRLRGCATPLSLSWRTMRKETVEIQCLDGGGWRLFVPVIAVRQQAEQVQLPSINRGDAVTIAVTGAGFSVSRPGEATEAGKVGEWIRVRPVTGNRRSRETVSAKVIRPGLVAMPLN